VAPFFNFIEDQLDYTRNDTEIMFLDPNCVTTTHGEGFAASSLTVGKDGGIVALEAAKD